MTVTSLNRWRRHIAVALSVILGLLLVSCDKPELPTGPTLLPPLPPPTVLRSSGPIALVSDRDGESAIYLANEDGSAVTKLVAGWGPAWSRNGRQIAFSSNRGDISVINVDGSGLRFVTDGTEPAWSPDGRSLVFSSWSRGSEIDIVNVDGSNRRSVFNSGAGASGATWSPDGQQILFSIGSFEDSCFGLWTVSPDGSGARQFHGSCTLPIFPGSFPPYCGGTFSDAWGPSWSSDGSEIAFGTQNFGIRRVEVARADGSGRHLRVPGGDVDDPDWTPDGRLIYTKGPRNGPSRIFISEGGTEQQLIPDATAPARPSYSDSQAVWLR